jgi:hypothetical protein
MLPLTMQTHSPAASRNTPFLWSLGLALVGALGLGTAGTASAQSAAARVMVVSGQAKAVDTQGRERMLEKGGELFAGDKVQTGEASLAQIRMNDGGYLSVRANTEMVIDKFVYDEKDPTQSNFLVSLLRGGFRSITGLIGRNNPSGYQIRASTATIGIRGTDHEPVLVLDTPQAQAQLQTQAPPGLYDKVNDGETFITTATGVLALKRGDVGFAPLANNVPPQVLLKIPDFYKTELKTDARDPKEGGAEKGKGAGNLLRPSVSARREAQAQGQPQAAEPANPANPPTSPPAKPTAPAAGVGSATPPALTPEQKRAILQAITPTVPRSNTPGASLTPVAPTAPTAPTAPMAPTPPPPTQR